MSSEADVVGTPTYVWTWRVAAACRLELTRAGGRDLAGDADAEARWYADLFHPYDGRGDESATRVNAWLSILLARRDLARLRLTG